MVMERINFPDSWDWVFYSCELSLEDKADAVHAFDLQLLFITWQIITAIIAE